MTPLRSILVATITDFVLLVCVYFGLPNTSKLVQGVQLERQTAEGKIFQFVAGPKNKKYVRLNQLPKYLRAAILALEDARFYDHNGFDLIEIQKVIDDLDEKNRPRGASTITQQLAKNLYLRPERTLKRKIIEALITLKLENTLSKYQILELYINSIGWGRGLYGISDAATYYFKKAPATLSVKEAVFLAAIIPNPRRFGTFNEDQMPKQFVRAKMMMAVKELYRTGNITFSQFETMMDNPYEFTKDEF